MHFIAEEFDRWHSGPYIIAKYDDGFYAYQYFRYSHGGRDSKRLHPDDEPLPTIEAAAALCELTQLQPIPPGIKLIEAPIMRPIDKGE